MIKSLSVPDFAISDAQADHFARLALDCVDREYPNKIGHVMNSDADEGTPKSLHPAFYGCFDWHSSVHGHWLLVRLMRLDPKGAFAPQAEKILDQHFTPENINRELAYFTEKGRGGFERPYGISWYLQLCAELRQWDDPRARIWLSVLKPLEAHIAQTYSSWLDKLAYPIRIGTHNQSAFGFTLALDWARTAGNTELADKIITVSNRFYAQDHHCPINYEPSGEDFLSPCLMEADLMRRVLPQEDFAAWLKGFLPEIPEDGSANWLKPGIVNDASDGKLVHLDGVNLSRAWNLEMIAMALPDTDARRASLLAAAKVHADTGLAAVTSDHYSGGHWLASFATYLETGRGLLQTSASAS